MRGNISKIETTPLPSLVLVPLFFFFPMVLDWLVPSDFQLKKFGKERKEKQKNFNPLIISSY